MTEPQEPPWRPRWWVAVTTVLTFAFGAWGFIHEVVSNRERPAVLTVCLFLLVGAPAVVALERMLRR